MPHHPAAPSLVLLIAAGTAIGAFSWLAASALSGTFEPYDSGTGLLVNQVVLSVPAVYVAWRFRPIASAVLLIGTYLGMNGYSYAFGGAETRAWAMLGTVTSLFLVAGPALLALVAVLVRYFQRPAHE